MRERGNPKALYLSQSSQPPDIIGVDLLSTLQMENLNIREVE